MKRTVSITVNGAVESHDVEPRQLLVHFLRESAGLTGTNVGCDTSQCGACTVLLNGKAVKATAAKNEEFLLAMLDTDEGARYLGEFAFGTNKGVQRFTKNILFDEKIGGTVHMALGAGYPETGSQNRSAIHWDMICDLRQGGEVWVDGVLFAKDGKFTI